MNIMKNKLLFTVARIHNCWEHHQDGSDLLKNHQNHLFSLVFNDLKWALAGEKIDHYWSRWVDKYEEREIKDILQSEHEFKDYWKEINILEIIHAAIKTDGGNILIDRDHPAIFEKAPKGYFEKLGQTQGFLTSEHKFVDRAEAMEIAIKAGQIKKEDMENHIGLMSENIWADTDHEYDTVKGYYREKDTLKIKTW
jgi:hypothetical protein